MTFTQKEITEATEGNQAFSRLLPGLQTSVDSTSLGTFKDCPKKYLYSIVMGLQPRAESVHLTFGLFIHSAREKYEHARQRGMEHEDALRYTVLNLMKATWNEALGRGWQSDHNLKNRLTLIRSAVWYLDEFGQSDRMETQQLADGRPAIELSFQFDSGYAMPSTNEPVMLCGHLDRIAKLEGELYVVDIKTTGHQIGSGFFLEFTPGNQFSMYCLAGRVAFAAPVRGVIVDGMQIAVGFTRVQRGLVHRTEAQLDEWLGDVGYWLGEMNDAAEAGVWPQNDKSCHHYGGCQFRQVCSRPPGARRQILASDFTRRVWDPTRARGDV